MTSPALLGLRARGSVQKLARCSMTSREAMLLDHSCAMPATVGWYLTGARLFAARYSLILLKTVRMAAALLSGTRASVASDSVARDSGGGRRGGTCGVVLGQFGLGGPERRDGRRLGRQPGFGRMLAPGAVGRRPMAAAGGAGRTCPGPAAGDAGVMTGSTAGRAGIRCRCQRRLRRRRRPFTAGPRRDAAAALLRPQLADGCVSGRAG